MTVALVASSRHVGFLRLFYLAAVLTAAGATVAEAHPHVWVDTVVTALLRDGKIAALREEWVFDEDFTATALSEVRHTKGMAAAMPRPLTDAEVQQLKDKAFANLANYAYFTHVWAGGKAVGVALDVSAFAARMDGMKLAYTFTLPLAQPVDPTAGPIRVGVWDDTYYVDVGPAKGQAALLEGDGSANCRARIIDDKEHLLYMGSITPKVMEFTCPR